MCVCGGAPGAVWLHGSHGAFATLWFTKNDTAWYLSLFPSKVAKPLEENACVPVCVYV